MTEEVSLPDDDEDFELDVLEEYPSLKVVAPFLAVMKKVHWFSNLGEDPDQDVVKVAREYADRLGFPDAWPAFLGDWEEAAEAAESLGFNSPAWEAEEQLRASLTETLMLMLDEETLELVTMHVNQEMSPIIEEHVQEVAEDLGIEDEEFLLAAMGAAAQACYLAVLAVMSGAGEDHPLVVRFRIFEAGYWPIGILGNSFLIY
ncbi:hypothetical protein GCM10017044_06900 [Kordiimonas sediminis]|uniref:Uncharacterized protein n=1 Tax=Kordiimonas sediminis TaxID=1735581 RepID=A0A919E5A7_9PROT|nr:hypothetical protein [Kordiimonas sediminis]GHF15373.1 hypothetical protein GCM10017044_06900 [Kordiimonas sediminis]